MLETAKKLVGRGVDVGTRVTGLERAVEVSRGRLDGDALDHAATIADRAGTRLRLSADHTVVALAGATGSGKSSTFNGLTGLDLAAVGVRRPTTSWATACVWGAEGAEDLLDWLGIPKRHQVSRDSMLDTPNDERDLQGLVLLDLPDHDSTEVSHHVEVDRLVDLSDLLIWVLDPQKYADAAIHDRYLKPLSRHREIMMIVLNQIDAVPEARRSAMVDDLTRLLADDGLEGVPLLVTSAKTGEGVPELKRQIAQRVAAKKATKTRLLADVLEAAESLAAECGTAQPRALSRQNKAELVDAFAEAAGVPTVVRAIEKSTRVRARRATGWPVTAWLTRLKPDPLKRLHLDLGEDGTLLNSGGRTSLPESSPVQRARVDTAVRSVADEVSEGLSRPWADAVRGASVTRLPDLNDALDQAITSTDLGVSRTPVWWQLVRVLQVVLVVTAVVGAGWLLVLAGLGFLQVGTSEAPTYAGLPVPTLLLLGGVAAGVLLALLSRLLVGFAARSRGKAADRRLRQAIGAVTQQLVIDPIDTELEAYRAAREGLTTALR